MCLNWLYCPRGTTWMEVMGIDQFAKTIMTWYRGCSQMMNILMHLFKSSPQQPVRSDGVSAEGEGDSGGSPGGVMADRSLGACNIFGNNNIFTYILIYLCIYLFLKETCILSLIHHLTRLQGAVGDGGGGGRGRGARGASCGRSGCWWCPCSAPS